jgi:hypothetical protein
VAGASLDELNYPRHCIKRGKEYRINSATLSALDTENKQLRARARKLTSPMDLNLRKPQALVMESIRVRFA